MVGRWVRKISLVFFDLNIVVYILREDIYTEKFLYRLKEYIWLVAGRVVWGGRLG